MTRRQLTIVPIVHSEADLGDLATVLRDRLGNDAWAARQRVIDQLWHRIVAFCDTLDPEGLRLYQDALPASEAAEQIVRELAEDGSANHQLLVNLIARGGVLVGTEDPSLLLREYAHAQRIAATNSAHATLASQAEAMELLARRDEAIAKRIDQTLPPGGRGLLLVGLLHNVRPKLPRDISVTIGINIGDELSNITNTTETTR